MSPKCFAVGGQSASEYAGSVLRDASTVPDDRSALQLQPGVVRTRSVAGSSPLWSTR